MALKVRIWWAEDAQAYMASFPYNEKFVEALKALIPTGERDWDPTTKIWYVKEKYGAFLHQLAGNAFGVSSVSFTSKEVAEQARAYSRPGAGRGTSLTPSVGTTEDALIAFFSLVPYDAAKRCYLMAAQALHPDKPNGDAVKMTRLNELWSRLEKEYFKR
jgi:hypothetical protein